MRFNELWGYADTIKHTEYIIMGSTDSIYFFDVTDPAKIKLCDVEASRDRGCINRDFQTYSHYAYAVSDVCAGSLQVFDMDYLPDSVHKVWDNDITGISAHTICAYKDKLYMCSCYMPSTHMYAMRIVSLANPESPVILANFNAPLIGGKLLFQTIHDMTIVDDKAYLSCGDDGLFVYDISDPTNLKYIYSINTYPEKGYNHSSWLSSDKKHIIFTDETRGLGVKLYEIKSPTLYKLKSVFRSHPGAIAHNPFIVGNDLAYISYYHDGIYLFDISDDTNPKVLAYYDTYPEDSNYSGYTGCWGVYPFMPSGNIFASDMVHGLFALKMKVPISAHEDTVEFNNEELSLFPNPCHNSTTLKFLSVMARPASLEIIDRNGKLVYVEKLFFSLGVNQFTIPTASLSQGLYLVRIIAEDPSFNITYNTKFVKY
jgi:choice-of-anchor B domain-containing protein